MTTTTITTITHTTEGADGTKTETRSSSSTSNTTTLIPIPVPVPVPVILPIPIPVYPSQPSIAAAATAAGTLLHDSIDSEPKNSPYLFPSVPAVLAKLSPFASSLTLPSHQLSPSAVNPHPPIKPAVVPYPGYSSDGDSDSDSDDLYSPSQRFSSFSLTPPPLYPYPHPLCPATAHFFSCLPSEIVYHVSSYCDIQSLLSLASLTRPLALELSVDFWKFQFISRWGSEYEVDYETRVSASMGQLMQGLRSSSAFVWNAIEFSYSEGLIPRRENRMTALVPNTTAPGLEWVGGTDERERVNRRGVRVGVTGHSGRRVKKCSDLAPPVVRSLLCPRADSVQADVGRRNKALQNGRQWKLACIIRSTKGADEVELRRCALCNQLDCYTSVMRSQESADGCADHGNTSWLSPCSCGRFTHRSCLESVMYSEHLTETEAMRCDVCASPYHISQRLAISLPELLLATWRDRRWLSLKFITVALPVYLLALLVIFVLENLRFFLSLPVNPAPFIDNRPTDAIRLPLPINYVFMVWHHLLICILFSGRFHSTVSRIYYTPLYIFYLKLYLCMLSSFIVFFFSFISCPLPASFPLQRLILWLSTSSLATAAALLNALLYLVSSSVLIFLFWKTEYRVQTLRGEGGRGGVGEGRVGDGQVDGGEWREDEAGDEGEHQQHECLTCGLVHFRSH